MGMTKEQGRALAEGFFNALGGNFSRIKEEDYPIIEKLLLVAGKEFVEMAVNNLEKSNAIDTGDLLDFAIPQVYKTDTGFILEVGYPETSKQSKYYDYINKGVQGRGGKNAKLKKTDGKYKFRTVFPSKGMKLNIFKWMKRAAISVRNTKKSYGALEEKRRSISGMLSEAENKRKLAFIIGMSIKRDGIKATHYFDDAVKIIFDQNFRDAMIEALKGDVLIQIKSVYDNNTK